MRTLLSAILILVARGLASGETADRQMVLTFDDLPAQRAQSLPAERIQMITDSLVSILADHRIPALGFVNEDKLFRDDRLDPGRVRLLERWLDAGIELGNHTFSHPDLHRVPLGDFQRDVLKGEEITRPLATARSLPYRYFRHPFLHTGLDLETKTSLVRFLDERGYRVAPVTIDNSEWIFARAFDEALDRNDTDLQQRLGGEYVEYMMQMVAYYENQSRALFDREIPQVLLLHANALNAHYLESLLDSLRRRGYRFIDLSSALMDVAFSSADTYVGPAGITWLHRWASSRGMDATFYQGEPITAQWVQDIAGIEE